MKWFHKKSFFSQLTASLSNKLSWCAFCFLLQSITCCDLKVMEALTKMYDLGKELNWKIPDP